MSYVDAALAPQRKTGQIKLHGPAAFEAMRKAGRLVAECLDMLAGEVRPGVPTEKIDRLVFDFAMAHNATPATMMYRGYRKATCTAVNHVVCHGIRGEKPLMGGDLVAVDVARILDGRQGKGIVLRPGMFCTVEPMINLGRPHVKVLSDGWTAVTRDRSLSAQFEHTVAVTDTGVEIFTLSPKGLDRPPLSVGPRA